MATKAAVLKLAKQRYGANAVIREHKSAPTPEQRAAIRARMREIRERLPIVKAERQKLVGHWQRLLEAAAFVCDVDGDSPSILRLREAVVASRAEQDLADEQKALEAQWERLRGLATHYRYGVECNNGAWISVPQSADTLEDLAAKMKD